MCVNVYACVLSCMFVYAGLFCESICVGFHILSSLVCQTGGTAIIFRRTYTNMHSHIHSLSVLAFLDNFPSTLLKHENEIDSLGLKDGTADKQLLPASMASFSGQWFGAAKWHSCNVLEQFPHKYLLSSVVFLSVCVGVWAMTISAMSVIL